MTAYISLPSYLNTLPQRYRLIGKKCQKCGTVHFPPRLVCRKCGGREFTEEPLAGQGKIYTYTILARGGAPTEFDDQQNMTGEFAVAVVELNEGPRVMGQMTECKPRELKIGMPVSAVIRRLYDQEGVIRYGFKFKPE